MKKMVVKAGSRIVRPTKGDAHTTTRARTVTPTRISMVDGTPFVFWKGHRTTDNATALSNVSFENGARSINRSRKDNGNTVAGITMEPGARITIPKGTTYTLIGGGAGNRETATRTFTVTAVRFITSNGSLAVEWFGTDNKHFRARITDHMVEANG